MISKCSNPSPSHKGQGLFLDGYSNGVTHLEAWERGMSGAPIPSLALDPTLLGQGFFDWYKE